MGKRISIIVPYYRETESQVFPLLCSISNQVGVDFEQIECIMVNDGADNQFSARFTALFNNINLRFVFADENRGPGIARQIGIDSAKGDYLLFCDADDQLHSCAVLGVFMQEADKGHDIVASSWLEELRTETGCIYIDHANECTWMHGKMIRRQFLVDNDIRFHPELRIHEDSYFLALAYSATDKIVQLPITTYVWRYHDNSITRKDNAEYTYASMPVFVQSTGMSFAEIERRNPSTMAYKAVQFIIYMYFIMQQPYWREPACTPYLEETLKAFREMIALYMHYYDNAAPEFIGTIYSQERAKRSPMAVELETLSAWLQRVAGKEPPND